MCLAPKIKVPKVEAPAIPPPAAETASQVRESKNPVADALSGRRRGTRSLMIERAPGAGINPSAPTSGLRL